MKETQFLKQVDKALDNPKTFTRTLRKLLKKTRGRDASFDPHRYFPGVKEYFGSKRGTQQAIAKKINARVKDSKLKKKIVQELWNKSSLDEQLIAADLIEYFVVGDLKFARAFIEDSTVSINNWAICDALATSYFKLMRHDRKHLKALAKKQIKKKHLWQRRFGIVLYTKLSNRKYVTKEEAKQFLKETRYLFKEDEKYIVKALHWFLRELTYSHPLMVEGFVTDIVKKKCYGSREVIVQGIKKLPGNVQKKIRSHLR